VIFVTVGSQMPFDRLIVAMDEWAAARPGLVTVLAQNGASAYRPRAMEFRQSLTPAEYSEAVRACKLMVAHAGMGSVLTAMEIGRPLVLLPRRGALRETRDDHQVETAKWLQHRDNVFVAMHENDLPEVLDKALSASSSNRQIATQATPPLLDALKSFIDAPPGPPRGRVSNQSF
jgi:UDP-N-acetylglucosamine transferase subunit ALG13